MKLSKVGNQTNSQDPQAVNSRVFVGNLNTFQCSKIDLERMFQRYGRLAGISMHKGYAFVQFKNPFDARSACLGEDGRTVLGQLLDVNMVAEPKPHQIGRKRQNVAKTGNDWDYYYDSYCASTGAYPVGLPHRLVPTLKRSRLMPHVIRPAKMPKTNNQHKSSPSNTSTINILSPICTNPISTLTSQQSILEQLKIYSNPDILICGNCREMFSDLNELIEHKKTYCKLRFTCKCHTFNPGPSNDDNVQNMTFNASPNSEVNPLNSMTLLCVQCKDSFGSAWDLMVHVQTAHMANIYELGVVPNPCSGKSEASSRSNSPKDFEMEDNKNNSTTSSSIANDSGAGNDNALEYEQNDHLIHQRSPIHSLGDKEMHQLVQNATTQACIMRALTIGSMSKNDCTKMANLAQSDVPQLVVLTNGKP